jgi:hypothetical protein
MSIQVSEFEALYARLRESEAENEQKRKDIDYLLERQRDQLTRADSLIAVARQLRAENETLRKEANDEAQLLTAQAIVIRDLRAEVERITNMRTNDLDQEIIDRLTAENERLRETIAEWQEIHGTLRGDVHAACQAEIERLRAEQSDPQVDGRVAYLESQNQRLRAALQQILDHPAPSRVATVAREALDRLVEHKHPPILDTAAPGWPDVDTLGQDKPR